MSFFSPISTLYLLFKISERFLKSVFTVNTGLPVEHTFGLCNIRLTNFWIVFRQFFVNNLTAAPGKLYDLLREFKNSNFLGITNVDRLCFVRLRESIDPIHKIIHVCERSSLRPITKYCNRISLESLTHKGRKCTPVAEAHSGSVSIKYPNNPCFKIVVSVIPHRHSFSKSLGLIVYAAKTNRIYIAPVIFFLRMNLRITVHLAC